MLKVYLPLLEPDAMSQRVNNYYIGTKDHLTRLRRRDGAIRVTRTTVTNRKRI